MEITLPVRIVRDHQGNILHREYQRAALTKAQTEAVCALLVKLDSDRDDAAG